jgi:hypothetical protein
MRKFSKKQYLAAGAAAVIVASGAGVAFAYWTDSGSGTGTATTGTSSPWSVVLGTATGGPLAPGTGDEVVSFTVKNVGTGHQSLASTVASITGVTGNPDTCDPVTNYAVSATSLDTGAYGDIAPNGTVTGHFTVSMNDLSSSQDGCKGATVNLKVAAS